MKTLCGVWLPILTLSLAVSAQASTITYDGALLQSYTVATTGLYDIVAYGAQGGNGDTGAQTPNPLYAGGKGAEIGASFALNAGDVLDFYVGGQGTYAFGLGDGGGGGGGTFVYDFTTSTLLLAAGGGGGGNNDGTARAGGPGLTGTSGGNGNAGGTGGTNGHGAAAGNGNNSSGGGGGYLSAGGTAIGTNGPGGVGGGDFPNLAGGTEGGQGANGGYGGGGGTGSEGGGGGGGYSGGGGGSAHAGGQPNGAGGGGGSFNGSLINVIAMSGVNTGNGLATIQVEAPEPASFGLALLSLLAIPMYRRWRRPQAE